MPMQSITFWGILILIAVFLNPKDFTNGLWNPFTVGTALVVVTLIAFQVWMETQRKRMIG
jgi:hypothetical protein